VTRLFMELKKTYYSFRGDLFCNILFEVGVCMKLLNVIKMCLTETYTKVRVYNYLSDICPIRNGLNEGNTLLPLLFTFLIEFAIRLACNYMVKIFSWVMLMMLIYWEEA
jgi:hypothetical protein